MKSFLNYVLMAAVVAAAPQEPSPSGIIAYDGIAYDVGVDLAKQTQPAPFNGWKAGAMDPAPGVTTSADSLSYTKGSALATTGNKVVGGNWQTTGMGMNFGNSAWDSYKVNTSNHSNDTVPMIGQGTIYVSFLMQSTSDNESAFGLYTGDTNANPWSQLVIGTTVHVTATGAVTLRTASYNPSKVSYDQVALDGTDGPTHTVQNNTSLSVAADSVNFYVLKVEFGATDKVSLFLNPTIGRPEGEASATMTTPAGEELIFSSFAAYLGSNAETNFVDEIRFGSTWASVAPVAITKPASYTLLGPGALPHETFFAVVTRCEARK